MDYEQKRNLKLNCHSNIAPRRQSLQHLNIHKRRGAWAPAYVSTEQHLIALAEGLPEGTNGIGDSRKNDRDRSTLITGKSWHVYRFRVVDSRQNLDANQSN